MTLQQALNYATIARAQMLNLAITIEHLAVIRNTDETVLRFLADEVVRSRDKMYISMVLVAVCVWVCAIMVLMTATK
jgi:hypothetical protein